MTDDPFDETDPRNNRVTYAGDRTDMPSVLAVGGDGNRMDLGSGGKLAGLQITVKGSRNRLTIGGDCILNGRIVIKGNGRTVRIGARTTFQHVTLYSVEGCDVTIGEDCMFSKRIEIRTSDSHSIIDRTTGLRLNRPGSVTIGDHVWIGLDAVVSKGVRIPEHSIVGAKSFVNKSFYEPYVLIAGVPATVIRRNVDWDRRLLPFEAAPALREA
ncbi:MAG TPA: acyltransferase [Hansschlegelia sp.]